MKLYIIQWGYSSCNDGGNELDSIWTDKTKAYKFFNDKGSSRHLKKSKKSKDVYTDGDYWIAISEVNSDSEWLYGEPE